MQRLTTVALLIFCCFQFQAQDAQQLSQDYLTLQSYGKVPALMLKSSSEKYVEKTAQEISKDEKKQIRKAKDEFYLSSTFQLDELIKSGDVIFGDEISIYLNEILDKIKSKNRIKDKELVVFTVKSSKVNAFATDQGILFFTTGLLARLESEDELAFVMCHEITHYLEKHNIDSHIKKSEMQKRGKRIASDALVEQLSNYSKEHEFTADLQGFELFKKLDYNEGAAISALGKLSLSHTSQYSMDFEPILWDGVGFSIPQSAYNHTLLEITPRLEEDDEKSSHPNISKRIAAIEEELSSTSDSTLVQSSDEFQYVHRLAQFETLNQMVLGESYMSALYDAYCLKMEYPQNVFLDRVIGHSIYGIAKLKLKHPQFMSDTAATSIEGPAGAVRAFTRDLSSEQIGAVALRANLKLSETYPEDESYRLISNDLATDLLSDNDSIFSRFEQGAADTNDFHFNALQGFDQGRIQVLFKLGEENVSLNESNSSEKMEFLRYKRKGRLIPRYEMGDNMTEPMQHVMIYPPRFQQLQKGYNVDLVGTEAKKNEVDKVIQEMAKKAKVDVSFFSTSDLKSNGTDKLNEMALINQFLTEYFENIDMKKVPFTVLPEDLKSKMGGGKILFTSILEDRERPVHFLNLIRVFGVYSIPDMVHKIIRPERNVKYEHLLIDIETQEILFYEYSAFFGRNNSAQMNAKYYNLFYKLKKKRR